MKYIHFGIPPNFQPDAGDQVLLVVQNIRTSLVEEYNDILWNIIPEKMPLNGMNDLQQPLMEDYFAWRDLRVMEEVHFYGWFIDYWMEVRYSFVS